MIVLLALAACKGTPSEETVEPCTWGPEHSWQENGVHEDIDAIFAIEMDSLDAQGVAYAVLLDGEIVYAGAHGLKERQGAVPMEPDTLMRGGSTLKMQTAAAALAVEADGQLTRDTMLGDVLPAFDMPANPGEAGGATLHQLLSHQGGFYDYTPIDGPTGPNVLYNHAHGVFASELYMLTEPGNFYNYSNPNFSMAALMAQEASGTPYEELMEEALWKPLCMTRTTLDADDVFEDGNYATARGTWESTTPSRIEPDSYDHGFARPAGFAWTSTMDMLHFAHFLLEGNEAVMSSELSSSITTAQVDMAQGPTGQAAYGYGMFISNGFETYDGYTDAVMWSHGGDIPGYAADLYIVPDSRLALAVLSNSSGAHFSTSALAAIEILTDLPQVTPPTDGLPNDPLEYAGTYEDVFNVGVLDFRADGDDLVMSAPLLDDVGIPYEEVLTPVSEDNYVLEIQGMQLLASFVRDESGEPSWFRTRVFVADRSEEPTVTRLPSATDADRVRSLFSPMRNPLETQTPW